jgi:hypothetical protein
MFLYETRVDASTLIQDFKLRFQEDFNRGKLFNLWKDISTTGEYLSKWAQHRMDVAQPNDLPRSELNN